MRRGYSLLEVLVAGALSLLVLVLACSALVMASRAWGQAQRMQNAQRGTLSVAYRLRQDYAASLPGSLRLGSGLVSFVSDDKPGYNEAGEALWHQWVQFRYTSVGGKVERRQVPLDPPVTQAPSAAPSWNVADRGVLLAESVTLFEVTNPGSAGVLKVRLQSLWETSHSGLELEILPGLYGQD